MSKIKVTFNEEGDAFVDTSDLEAQIGGAIAQREANMVRYMNEKDQLAATQAGAAQHQQRVSEIVSSNDQYAAADKIRTEALTLLNEHVMDFQRDNGLTGTVNTAQALKILEHTGGATEFAQKYPDLSLLNVLDSLNSPYQLEIALQEISNTLPDPEASTPTGIARMNTASEIMEMDDDTIDAMLRQLADEEAKDGIDW